MTEAFKISDIDPELTDAAKLVMADTILAWAELDTGISYLIFLVFGIDLDGGSILVGNMDLKTKVERIKMLYEHHGLAEEAKIMATLKTDMQDFSKSRNTIAHRKWVGRLKSDHNRQVFMSSKHSKKNVGVFEVTIIHETEFKKSTDFAKGSALGISKLINTIESLDMNCVND